MKIILLLLILICAGLLGRFYYGFCAKITYDLLNILDKKERR